MKLFKIKNNKGLTLLELLVVLAIFALVTGIVLFNYGDFRNNVSVSNLAQEAALAVRKAQSYAIGVKSSQPGGAQFTGSYGAYFVMDASVPDSAKRFIIFADRNGNDRYDGPFPDARCGMSSSECLEEVRIQTSDRIHQVCATDTSGIKTCAVSVGAPKLPGGITTLPGSAEYLILFKRPNTSARLLFANGYGTGSFQSARSIAIDFMSARGLVRTVEVFPTGYIGVVQ